MGCAGTPMEGIRLAAWATFPNLRPMIPISAVLGSTYGQHPRQRYDLFVPQVKANPVLVACIHGGGWTAGRHEDLRSLALLLAEHGHAAACIGHRLLNDGAKNGQELCEDVRQGVERAVEEAALLGASSRSVVLLGSGAGSLPALVAAWQLAAGGKVTVRGAVACGAHPTLEPWEHCAPATARLFEQFASGHRHQLSPMELDPHRFPPVLLVHGDSDPEVPAKQVTRLHTRLTEAGESSALAILSGLGHQVLEHPAERGGKLALERILPFLAEHAREPGSERLFCGAQG